MKSIRVLILCSLFFNLSIIYGQASAPYAEKIFGGRVNTMAVMQLNADTSCLFITCESSNSAFYADIIEATKTIKPFKVVPGLSRDDNFGTGIKKIAVDNASRSLFFIHESGLKRTSASTSVVTTIFSGNVYALTIYNSRLFFIEGSNLHFGTIALDGTFTESAFSPITVSTGWDCKVLINPSNDYVYVATFGATPQLLKSNVKYNVFTSTTSFTTLPLSALSSTVEWKSFGISPSGRLMFGGPKVNALYMAYSDDGTTWTQYAIGMNGSGVGNFAFNGTTVYWCQFYNESHAASGTTWKPFGITSAETHPNDGDVASDPNNGFIVFMPTDVGLAGSIDGGANIIDIVEGMNAVEINDFDMTLNKRHGWMASKSGVRKVNNFTGSLKLWSKPIWPNGDGSPYFSSEIIGNDSDKCYVGNIRVYKTTDNGASWAQKFTAEGAPYNYSSTMSRVEAIAVCPLDPEIVMAGYYIEGTDQGGVFYSHNGGVSWSQVLLQASSGYFDVDVMDIEFNMEGSDTVAYVGAVYESTILSSGRSVYRLVKRGSTWIAAQDMGPAGTASGTAIIATINDIYVSDNKDSVLAVGVDMLTGDAAMYYKVISGTNKWTAFPTTGLGPLTNLQAKAVTMGGGETFIAINNIIFKLGPAGMIWMPYYTYPRGTKINFLYYDALLAGTETGMDNFEDYLNDVKDIKTISYPEQYILARNFPNPFNPSTKIEYTINPILTGTSGSVRVQINIYDALGRMVAQIANDEKPAGTYRLNWNAMGQASGIYYCRIIAGRQSQTLKMMLLR